MTTEATNARGVWAEDEHERFLAALHKFPNGPWKAIAEVVGTRTVRQVQTHAQKYHEKAARRLRDLRLHKERTTMPQPTVDREMKEICDVLQRKWVPLSPRSAGLQQRSMERFKEAAMTYFADHDARNEDESIPSFDECLDFLIDALSTHECSDSDSSSP